MGKNSCPSVSGTTLVYAGRAGGTHYTQKGGVANHLCMPDDPDYLSYTPGVQGANYVYGALSFFVISKTHISAQKPRGRQPNAKVCGRESAIFLILSSSSSSSFFVTTICSNNDNSKTVQVLTVILS